MRTAFILLCLVFLMAAGESAAQFRESSTAGDLQGLVHDPQFPLNLHGPLLNPQRMQLHHSFSAGFGSSSRGSVGVGTYLSRLDYHLGRNMDLRLQLGVSSILHNSYTPEQTGNGFVGGAEIRWMPRENLELRIAAFRGMPSQTPGMFPVSRTHGSSWSGFPEQDGAER